MKHPNDVGSNKDLALYRVETAKDDLRAANIYYFMRKRLMQHGIRL